MGWHTRIDRLARSIADLQDIVRAVWARGGDLKGHRAANRHQHRGRQVFSSICWACFAEFETNLRRERRLEGIAKAKAAGVYKGRPASIDAARVRELKMQGIGPTEIRQGPQDRPGVGLPRIGQPLTARWYITVVYAAGVAIWPPTSPPSSIMASAQQLIGLVKSHAEGNEDRYLRPCYAACGG